MRNIPWSTFWGANVLLDSNLTKINFGENWHTHEDPNGEFETFVNNPQNSQIFQQIEHDFPGLFYPQLFGNRAAPAAGGSRRKSNKKTRKHRR